MLDLDGFILDMDGVIWRGSNPLPGIANFFSTLRRLGIPFVFATNNSTLTAEQYVKKISNMGIEVRPEQILSSSIVTADYVQSLAGPNANVYVIGEDGINDAIKSRGFNITDEGAKFVVVGLDRQVTYAKIATAADLIYRGAKFIATNPDPTLPSPDRLLPGIGAILSAITTTVGVNPLVIGKPEPYIFTYALSRLGTRPEKTAMVGDRLETDILGGQRAGLKTILVLSGVSDAGMVANSSYQPDWVFDDIAQLADELVA
ncbi:MAG: HAD family hydrolase [Anaerolineales bacterium]|nr:HAD family hydrolase [Anaerolineales bacterium]